MTRAPYNRSNSGARSDEIFPKPYELVPFPKKRPFLKAPSGHHQYLNDRQHGALHLRLEVQTALHVSTGVIMMGSDIGGGAPLIKTMVQGSDSKLFIQGSSLKGCVRAVYEAITNSTLAVVTSRHRSKIPRDRLPCRTKENLCPASRIFGALDWQGLVEFSDAICEAEGFSTGFMPSLYAPRPDREGYYNKEEAAGRKFYYHANRAIDAGAKGVPVQQAAKTYTFSTIIRYKNLYPSDLGTLLIALGQDSDYPFALKVGGGKPIGMGTMTVTISKIEQAKEIRDRYITYRPQSQLLTDPKLQTFMKGMIKTAHSMSIEASQLKQLAEILRYPTDRQPPAGMY